jgi:Predicted membrane protein (DUF2306)
VNTAVLPRVAQALLAVPAVGVVAHAVVVHAFLPLGQLVHPRMAEVFRQNAAALCAHGFGAAFALPLGPLQFRAAVRARRPALHRLAGRLHLGVGVGVGGIAGLILAAHAQGGPVGQIGQIGQIGLGGLALAWLYTGVPAFAAVRSRDFVTHRRRMIRNLALTFAAVTLRIWMPLGFALDRWPFELVYPVVARLCWVPNLPVAEWSLRRRPRQAPTAA